MSTDGLTEALSALITVTIFLGFFYGPWQRYVTDVTRQRLFEQRDKLFDYALDHPEFRNCSASREIRELLNSMIRFSHDADIVHFSGILAFVLISKKLIPFKKAAATVEHMLDSVPTESRNEVRKLVYEAHVMLAFHVYRRSLILISMTLFLVIPFMLALILFVSTDTLSQMVIKKFGRFINAIAYEDALERG